jgi:hypothetical protein
VANPNECRFESIPGCGVIAVEPSAACQLRTLRRNWGQSAISATTVFPTRFRESSPPHPPRSQLGALVRLFRTSGNRALPPVSLQAARRGIRLSARNRGHPPFVPNPTGRPQRIAFLGNTSNLPRVWVVAANHGCPKSRLRPDAGSWHNDACPHLLFNVRLWLAWRTTRRRTTKNEAELLVLVAQRRVGRRAGRAEPRAVKRRPKAYRLLTQPRAAACEQVRKHGHPGRVKQVPFFSEP